MVIRRVRRCVLSVAVAVLAVVTVAPAAVAVNTNPPGTGTGSGSGGGSTDGSSGGSAETTVKTCHVYAGPSGFGLTCVTPGSGGDAVTIRKILGPKESLPSCFDTPVSASDLATQYPEYGPPEPGSSYYVHTCITGLDENSSPINQPNEQINNNIITIVDGSKQCFNWDEAHDKTTPFTPDQLGHCVETLTTQQQQVVSGLHSGDGQIPDITIAEFPSTRVRTNEDVAFVDTEKTSTGSGTRTSNLTVGGVTLYAEMDAFKIYPYGPDGTSITCNGTASVSVDDTPQTKPDACWFRYPRSSADQPGLVYPFRAEADWSVHIVADGVDRVFTSFQKYDDVKLPVYDIQTLVIR